MIYRLLLVAATVIWGSSFIIMKDTTSYLTPGWILVIRFSIAALILAAVFAKHRELYFKKEYIAIGALFGVALGLAYYIQTQGLVYTTPGKNAFLTGTYCVMVPFLAWAVSKKAPTVFNIVAAFVCVAGVGFISLGNETGINIGDILTLVAAFFYAVHIILVAKFSQGRNIYVLTMWQFVFVAILALVIALTTEVPPVVLLQFNPEQIAALLYLAIACTAVALLFQNIGQANVPPASASLLLSLESPFGVGFSVLAGAEILTGQIVFGFVLVFAAIVISEYLPEKMAAKKAEEE